jgi:hypothetical protein
VLLELIEHLQWLTARDGTDLDPVLRGSILPLSPPNGELGPGDESAFELGLQVTETARVQVAALQERVERAQLLVLINDWSLSQRVWWELVPDLRTPLLEMNFLWELWSGRPEWAKWVGPDLARLAEHIGLLQAQVELLFCRGGDTVGFSTLLEQGLLPWLREMDACLERIECGHSAS